MSDRQRLEATTVAKVARAELVKRILIVVTALMVTAALVLLAVVIGQVRATQQSGSPAVKAGTSAAESARQAAEAAQETNHQILDCLQPTGICYQESQKHTAGLLAQVQQIIVLAAACAEDVTPSQTVEQRQDAIAGCITKHLAGTTH